MGGMGTGMKNNPAYRRTSCSYCNHRMVATSQRMASVGQMDILGTSVPFQLPLPASSVSSYGFETKFSLAYQTASISQLARHVQMMRDTSSLGISFPVPSLAHVRMLSWLSSSC